MKKYEEEEYLQISGIQHFRFVVGNGHDSCREFMER
jgi:hypothetical protein